MMHCSMNSDVILNEVKDLMEVFPLTQNEIVRKDG